MYPIPTVNDIGIELIGAKFLSKLDLTQAYHQLPLHKDSRYITTLSTHLGLYHYTRLHYETNAAMEIFQHVLQLNFHGIKGIFNIADDIAVYGRTRQEHEQHYEIVWKDCKSKVSRYNQRNVPFFNRL